MADTDPATLDATALLRLYRRKELSPVEVTRACLDRIERWNDRVHAFCFVDGEAALAAARESETRWVHGTPLGLLDGVPATIKDLVLTRGWIARRGSHTTEHNPPAAADAPATARLREAGAVLLGSTTTPEFGWKGVTDNPLGHVARNPWDIARTPGGSSGGAAVAAALGMGALHVGTDGGGLDPHPRELLRHRRAQADLRSRAGLAAVALRHRGASGADDAHRRGCGAHAHGDQPPGYPRLDCLASPTARTIGSAWTVAWPACASPPAPRWASSRCTRRWPPRSARPCRFWRSWVRGSKWSTRRSAGQAASSRAPGFPAAARLLEKLPANQHARLDPGFVAMAEQGARYSRAEIQDAMLERGELGVAMQGFLAEYDLLATPSTALPAFAAGVEYPEPERPERWSEWASFSYPFNLTPAAGDQPALRLHRGRAADRPAARGGQVCRCAGAARRPRVRGGLPPAHARSTARGRSLTWLPPHAWLASAAPVRRAKDPEGGDFHAIVHQGHRAGDGVGAGARRRRGGQDAGLLLGGKPRRLQPDAVHRWHDLRCIVEADLQPADRVRARRHQDHTRPCRELHGLRRRSGLHLQAAPGREVAQHGKAFTPDA